MPSEWARRIYAPLREVSESRIAAFVGIFGRQWLDNALENIERQSIRPIQVVIAVNGDDAEIERRLRIYQDQTRHSVWVAINQTNLGPGGSWQVNRDLLTSPWIAYLHQDDVYLDDHLETLLQASLQSSENVRAIFTGLDGVSADGKRRLAGPPQVNRHLKGSPSHVLLPEIVRRHPFPTPTFCFRRMDTFSDMAWYDSGAPDSEWCARLACRGQIRVVEKVTALYRQPATSESSTTDWASRAWLWANSLNRLILSNDFNDLLVRIPYPSRTQFAEDMLTAIPFRYPTSPLFSFLQFSCAQTMCTAWEYREPFSLAFLRQSLDQVGMSSALRSLASLGAENLPRGEVEIQGMDLLGPRPRVGLVELMFRKIYLRFGHWLPRSLRLGLYDRLRSNRQGTVS